MMFGIPEAEGNALLPGGGVAVPGVLKVDGGDPVLPGVVPIVAPGLGAEIWAVTGDVN
ncbi:MAG: hypothetical protein JXB10_19880 [Pirellulales bacterium]|nr:hypothetical protein [Pirellulales bacterium]